MSTAITMREVSLIATSISARAADWAAGCLTLPEMIEEDGAGAAQGLAKMLRNHADYLESRAGSAGRENERADFVGASEPSQPPEARP